jgi:drug/metabolite transporter (DMT)-like permease
VLAVGAGVLLVRGRRPDPASSGFGVATAAAIAGYTPLDGSGVVRADPLAYLELVMVGPAALAALVVGGRLHRASPARRLRVETALIAPPTFAPFALALFAFRLAPCRAGRGGGESSVLVAVALAALFLRERVSAWHGLGAAAVAASV